MKVLFDHQIFHYKYGGASKYFAMLLNSLPREVWDTTARFSCNEYVRAKHLFPTCGKRFRGQNVLLERLNRPYTLWAARRGRFDIYHQTNFATDAFRFLDGKKVVTTFHDVNLSTFDPHPEIVERQRRSLERADAVICVSENTKRDMLSLFDVDEEKVHVIYHGIEMPDPDLLPEEPILPFPYFFYVGRRSSYKNFYRLAVAFAEIHRMQPALHLVCTDAPFSSDETDLFKRLDITDVIHHFAASELEMQRLYRDALLFVFPSLYEGFGMPILEAWSMRCPVVLSRSSCFPEIAGDAAKYFAAEDADEMAAAMLDVAGDNKFRKALIRKGNKRVKLFSWQRCAEAHMNVYSGLMERH